MVSESQDEDYTGVDDTSLLMRMAMWILYTEPEQYWSFRFPALEGAPVPKFKLVSTKGGKMTLKSLLSTNSDYGKYTIEGENFMELYESFVAVVKVACEKNLSQRHIAAVDNFDGELEQYVYVDSWRGTRFNRFKNCPALTGDGKDRSLAELSTLWEEKLDFILEEEAAEDAIETSSQALLIPVSKTIELVGN